MVINHLLIFSRSTPLHRIGGMEMLTWDLAKAFARRGIEVTIGTSEVAGKPPSFVHEGIRFETIKGTLNARYSKKFWAGTLEIFDRLDNVDGILSVSSAAREIVIARKSRTRPILMQAHGTSLGEMKTKWKQRTLKSLILSLRNIVWIFKDKVAMPHYDAVVCVSERVKSEFSDPWSGLGDIPKKYTIIDNGVDRTVFKFSEESRGRIRKLLGWGDAPVVVCACRLHAEKGGAELVRAFVQLKKTAPNAKLLIVGDGPDRRRLQTLVAELGVPNDVHFTGALPRSEVAAYLTAGDVFAFLSMRREGAPLNLLEALSVGVPSVLAKDLLEGIPGATGVWGVKPDDEKQAAKIIAEALEFASNGGRAVLPAKFAIDECASQYLQIFAGIRSLSATPNHE